MANGKSSFTHECFSSSEGHAIYHIIINSSRQIKKLPLEAGSDRVSISMNTAVFNYLTARRLPSISPRMWILDSEPI